MKPLFVLLCLALPTIAADRLRVLSNTAGVLRLGVSSDRKQFEIQTSDYGLAWTERGRTWILYGGTNEIVLSLTNQPGKTVYVRVRP